MWHADHLNIRSAKVKHRLMIVASALSLLICISAALLWATSYSEMDDIGWQKPVRTTGYDRWALQTVDGIAAMHHTIRDDAPYDEIDGKRQPQTDGLVKESWGLGSASAHAIYAIRPRNGAGFGWGTHAWEKYGRYREWRLIFPLWLPTLLTAVLPTIWIVQRVKHKRRQVSGRCIKCGYDLRASKERCPECGTPIRYSGN